MKKQIVQVSVVQSAKVVAGVYVVIAIPIALFFTLFTMATGQGAAGLMMAILMVLGYAVGGFLSSLLGAWIYNLVAARVGGIEFMTAEVDGKA